MREAVSNSSTQEFATECLARFAVGYGRHAQQECASNAEFAAAPPTESPLEEAFAKCWWLYDQYVPRHGEGGWLELRPQVAVDSYRVDFALAPRLSKWHNDNGIDGSDFPRICVELDGHEFHETTKAQATRRNQRDRALLANGWRIFRFSGSEFYADPFASVGEVWDYAFGHWQSWQLRHVTRVARLGRRGGEKAALHA